MDTILSFFTSGNLLSHTNLIFLLIGMLVAWHIPQPAWAVALWDKITKKAPVVDTAAQVATAAAATVATEVGTAVDAVKATTDAVETAATTTK